MRLSIKADYACRALKTLAWHYPNARPLRIEAIARRESIPANYLVQILIELKAQGLIRSRRGKAGGYTLAKSPNEITVGDVLRAVHGVVLELPDSSSPQEIKQVWRRIQLAAEHAADQIKLEDICIQADGKAPMYYI